MKRNEGFTLIELVVATAVLLVLTFMTGSLFRQATSAWDTGRVRGEGGMIARAILGAVSRDIVCAVDPTPYGVSWPSSGSSLTLVCLKAPDGDGNSVFRVAYSVGNDTVTRKERPWTGSGWGDERESILFKREAGEDSFSIDDPGNAFTVIGSAGALRDDAETAFGTSGTRWNGPAAVKVRIVFTQKGSFSGVAVRSRGRNGRPDEDTKNDDDIFIQ